MLHRLRLISFVPALTLLAACAVRLPAPTTWTGASGDPRVINVTEATFAPDSRATAAVRAECELERVIPQSIARWSPVPVVLAADATGAARVLNLEITDTWAPRGGAWTGPKSLTVRGELLEQANGDWVVVASFTGRRTTARVGGTCEMLETIANAVGKDVRAWLARPSLNAPLGELD